MVSWRALLAVVALAGCSVRVPEQIWACASDRDCIDSMACVRQGEAVGVCAPECATDMECGATEVCVRSSCLPGCDSVRTCPDPLSCARPSADPNAQLACRPGRTCSTSSDCGDGVCLGEMVPQAGVDGLPCLPSAVEGCPPGWIRWARLELCVLDCSSSPSMCPPMLTCQLAGALLGAPSGTSVCWPGLYGSPCVTSEDCVVGSCRAGVCTTECSRDEDCLPSLDRTGVTLHSRSDGLHEHAAVRCDEGICSYPGGIGDPCGGAVRCDEGLACLDGLCTRSCLGEDDCEVASLNVLASGTCDIARQVCRPLQRLGDPCELDTDCVEVCVDAVCARRQPPGGFCRRDEVCRSRRCINPDRTLGTCG